MLKRNKSKGNKMICPDCGVEMNQHAEKVSYSTSLGEQGSVDPDLGGILEEAHTCPECGKTEMRKITKKLETSIQNSKII